MLYLILSYENVQTLHLAMDDDMLKIVSVHRAYLGSAGRAFSTLISTKSIRFDKGLSRISDAVCLKTKIGSERGL